MNTTTALRTISTLGLMAALAGAGTAYAAPPNISTDQVGEGETFVLPISAGCSGSKKCTFSVTTESGTATAGADFTPATAAGTVRKNRTFTTTLNVPTTLDDLEESFETFTVKVTVTKPGKATKTFSATQSITPSAAPEAPEPAPAAPTTPAPAPAPEASEPVYPTDSGTPAFTVQNVTDGVWRECRTPMWVGKPGAYGAWGNYNSGCELRLYCPTTYRVCTVKMEGAINSERSLGQRVTLNSRITAFSTSGTKFWHRDTSCAGDDWCRTEDTVNIRGGENALVGCNGVHGSGPKVNRSSVRCMIGMEKLY